MEIKSVDHIELTVVHLRKSKDFYSRLPGFKLVAEYPNFVMFVCGDFKLGLTDHENKQTTNKFDEKNIGMDHVSFTVASQKDLEEALNFFEKEHIHHGQIKKLSNNAQVLAFRDPDNIQLELTWKKQ